LCSNGSDFVGKLQEALDKFHAELEEEEKDVEYGEDGMERQKLQL
jgi:hypothetical protein